jgi:hypothetical protein
MGATISGGIKVVKTKTKRRTRLTRKDIEKAREAILAEAKSIAKPKRQTSRKASGQYWGLIYIDSYGSAWFYVKGENKWLGKSEEIVPMLRSARASPDDPVAVFEAIWRFRSESKSQSCHSIRWGKSALNNLTPLKQPLVTKLRHCSDKSGKGRQLVMELGI